MTRILIADDHEVVRSGLRKILEAHPEWEVVAEVAASHSTAGRIVREAAEAHATLAVGGARASITLRHPGFTG